MKHKTSDVIVPTSAEYDAFVTRMSRVFIAAAFFVMMSQNLLAPNLTAAAASFGLTAQERDTIMGGWMSTAFFLVGGPCSLVRRGGCADWGALAAGLGRSKGIVSTPNPRLRCWFSPGLPAPSPPCRAHPHGSGSPAVMCARNIIIIIVCVCASRCTRLWQVVGYLVDVSNRKRLFLYVMVTGNVVIGE